MIHFPRTESELEFQKAVDQQDLEKTESILKAIPDYVHDETFFWGEGILMKPAKDGNIKLMALLMAHGAKVPKILKWAQAYYFKHYEPAVFLMENGMDPNIMSHHQVTLLHDMAQKGFLNKANLLVDHGAKIDVLEEQYQSTPLGLAAKWGQMDMVQFLLGIGANPNFSGAPWSTPLAWAIKKGHGAIEIMLRNAGAD